VDSKASNGLNGEASATSRRSYRRGRLIEDLAVGCCFLHLWEKSAGVWPFGEEYPPRLLDSADEVFLYVASGAATAASPGVDRAS